MKLSHVLVLSAGAISLAIASSPAFTGDKKVKTKKQVQGDVVETLDKAVQVLFADMSLINRKAGDPAPDSKQAQHIDGPSRFGRIDVNGEGPFFGFGRMPSYSTHHATMTTLGKFASVQNYLENLKALHTAGHEIGIFGFTSYPLPLNASIRSRYADTTIAGWPSQEFPNAKVQALLDRMNQNDQAASVEYNELMAKYEAERQEMKVAAKKLALEAVPLISKNPKRSVDGQSGQIFLRAKAIRLNDAQCLACHADNKKGDPIAIMVYAVKDTNPKP